MKLKIILISFLVILGSLAYSQNDNYGIIYLNRLKKSTQSYKNYKVWIGDKLIGTLDGTNPTFTDKYYGRWMVFTAGARNKVPIKITEGKKNTIRALLILNLKKDGRYFLTFNTAAEFNENPLQLIDEKEGLSALNKSKLSDIAIKDSRIKQTVVNDKENGLVEYEKEKPTKKPIKSNTLNSASILVNNSDSAMVNDFLNSIKAKSIEKYLKEGKFDLFKSYYYEPNVDTNLIDDIKESLKETNKNDSVIIYYSEKDKRIYVAVNYFKK